MVITNNDGDHSGPVDGGAAFLLLNISNKELHHEIASNNIIATVNQLIWYWVRAILYDVDRQFFS